MVAKHSLFPNIAAAVSGCIAGFITANFLCSNLSIQTIGLAINAVVVLAANSAIVYSAYRIATSSHDENDKSPSSDIVRVRVSDSPGAFWNPDFPRNLKFGFQHENYVTYFFNGKNPDWFEDVLRQNMNVEKIEYVDHPHCTQNEYKRNLYALSINNGMIDYVKRTWVPSDPDGDRKKQLSKFLNDRSNVPVRKIVEEVENLVPTAPRFDIVPDDQRIGTVVTRNGVLSGENCHRFMLNKR
jgi:hypothetical protein